MLGDNIRLLRSVRGISQVELGEKLNVSKQSISNWENGNIQEEGNYKNYRKTGDWTEYNREKEIEKVITYSDKGAVIRTRWYK